MANITGTLSRPLSERREKTVTQLILLRLMASYTLLIISLIGLLGGDWDIQWHATIGRDRTFTPPHDMILLGIGLSGIVALVTILIETSWVRHNEALADNTTDFLGVLHSSNGSYLVGFGAICAAIAFPLDTYWHALYGIDVSLWAPFHTMIYMGGVLSTIGVAYMLLSIAHLALEPRQKWQRRLGYIGLIAILGTLISKLLTFSVPAIQGHAVAGVNIFPFLLAASVAFVSILAIRIIPWRGAATLTILALLIVCLIVNMFVPPMMNLLIQIEHQTYLAHASHLRTVVLPTLGQSFWLLLCGPSIDGIMWLSMSAHWSSIRIFWGTAFAAALSAMLVVAITLPAIASQLAPKQHALGGHRSVILVLALVLAVPGGLLGSWIGSTISKTLQELRG